MTAENFEINFVYGCGDVNDHGDGYGNGYGNGGYGCGYGDGDGDGNGASDSLEIQ